MTDIFLSYASEDRGIARAFVEVLEGRGWTVWWDRAIRPGAAFAREIDHAITGCRCVVVLWSSSSVLSGWVNNEALEGLDRRILVPVKIEDVRTPVAFRSSHTALLQGWPGRGDAAEFDGFINSIDRILSASEELVGASEEAPIPALSGLSSRHQAGPKAGTLAVLPFDNLTGVGDNDYICDGLSDELRNELAALPSVQVISRSSSVHASKQVSDARVLGQMLETEKVLEGRVQRYGDGLRLSVEIISVVDGFQLWASSLSLSEDRLIEATAELVRSALSQFPAQQASAVSLRYEPDPEAHKHFLRGRFFFNSGDTVNRKRAIQHYSKAVEIDQEYVAAYCGLASSYLLRHIGSNDPVSPLDTFEAAKVAGLKAFALDPDNSASLGVMGSLYLYDWQWQRAKDLLLRSLELDPSDAMVRHSYASLLNYEGKTVEAGDFMEETLQYDPLSPIAVNGTARIFRYLGRFSDAYEMCERLLSAMPNSLAALEEMVESAFMARDYELGERYIDKLVSHLGEDHPTIIWHRARLSMGLDDMEGFAEHFRRLRLVARTSYVNSAVLGFCYMFSGKMDRALDYWERGVQEKDSWLIDLRLMPVPRAMTTLERYQEVLQAIHCSPPRMA